MGVWLQDVTESLSQVRQAAFLLRIELDEHFSVAWAFVRQWHHL